MHIDFLSDLSLEYMYKRKYLNGHTEFSVIFILSVLRADTWKKIQTKKKKTKEKWPQMGPMRNKRAKIALVGPFFFWLLFFEEDPQKKINEFQTRWIAKI